MRPIALFVVPVVAGVVALTPTPAGAAPAVTYHVSPTGDDGADGLTPATAWRTLARVGAADLEPGDTVLLQGGATFTGTVVLDEADAGTADAPVVIGSYGDGRAVVESGPDAAVFVYRAGGVEVRDLVVRGDGTGAASGVTVYNDLSGDVLLDHVRVADVEASGYAVAGVSVGGWNGRSGYRDVVVERVHAHGNGRMGITVWAAAPSVHRDVVVRRSLAEGNTGRPDLVTASGHGIYVGGVTGGLVEHNVARDNGGSDQSVHAAGGVAVHASDTVVVRGNEVSGNRTGGPVGGNGVLVGSDVRDVVVEGNVSHGNQGAGHRVEQEPTGGAGSVRVVVRNGLSHGDATAVGRAAVEISGPVTGTAVHAMTVVTDGAVPVRIVAPGSPPAGPTGVVVANNVLVAAGDVPLVDGPDLAPARVRFTGNLWWAPASTAPFRAGSRTWPDLAAWRASTGQEGGAVPTGAQRPPRFVGDRAPAGGAGAPIRLDTVDDIPSLAARFGPSASSAAVDLGVDLAALGVDPVAVDLAGAPVQRARDAGAFERQGARGTPLPGLTTPLGPVAVVDGEVVRLPVAAGDAPTAAARTAAGGSWTADATGRIVTTGDATFAGDLRGLRLNAPINGMAPTPTGNGYWMVASDGGIFAFGDARFLGSMGGRRLNQPIVAMATTPSGNGYWLAASDGGVFAFGDAGFFGSLGSLALHRPIVGMAATPSGRGYWLFASDGGVFAFGDAGFHGSLPGVPGLAGVGAVGMVPAPSGRGYWIVTPDLWVVPFGDVES